MAKRSASHTGKQRASTPAAETTEAVPGAKKAEPSLARGERLRQSPKFKLVLETERLRRAGIVQ